MHLVRCKDQRKRTLDEFYIEVTKWDRAVDREIGVVMLDLIARLRALPNDQQVFGLTSLVRLCLLAEDSWQSPWFVVISALNKRNYYVEYLVPKDSAPWPNAYVKGEACSEDEAVRMIEIAMEKSGGWR